VRTYRIACLLFVAAFAAPAVSQDQPQQPPAADQQPPVHVTVLNVCTPPDDEKKLLADTLAHIAAKPAFSSDFEVARGRTAATGGELAARLGGTVPASTWVRMRREFASGYFANVQYSMTRDDSGIAEVLVFRVRDPKEVMQIALSDAVTSAADPGMVLAGDTPAARIKIERFGKSSVGLAHCPGADQKPYQALFTNANQVLASYRTILGARTTVPGEFARLGKAPAAKPKKAASGTAPSAKSKPQKQ
jgi:hypothetical protein